MARDAMHTLDALGLAGRVCGFFESASAYRARQIDGVPVQPIESLDCDAADVLVAVGAGHVRAALVASLPAWTRYPIYVHPGVPVGRRVELGAGTFIGAGCILTCDITVGSHVQLNIGTTVTHDCVLGDYVTTAPGVRLSGGCRIGEGAFLGSGACVRERVSILPGAVVGMGAVVLRDVPGGVWVGNPARQLR